MLTAPTTLQQHLQAWHAELMASDWPEPIPCTRCGQDHEVEDCPHPSTYELPVDMDSVTTGSTTTFEDLADWPEAVRKQ